METESDRIMPISPSVLPAAAQRRHCTSRRVSACGGVTGDVRSGGDVACGSVGGSVRAGGDVVCRKGGDGFVFTTGERNVEVSDVAETVEDIRQTAKGLKDSLREMFRRKPSEEE